jgi:uncharacterized protein (DUF1015 family)
MPEIQPFAAVLYNTDKVNPADVLTQPYDKITPAMQQQYLARSPYNLIRIELGTSEPTDTDTDNKYTRAAALYQQWLRDGVLRRAARPALYYLKQTFTPPNTTTTLTRKALIARVRLHRWDEGKILPHEHTLSKPKADRLALLKATGSQQGQIFMLYPQSIPFPTTGTKLFDLVDDYHVTNTLSEITDPAAISTIQRALEPQTFYIADGHHRYETALAYRDETQTEPSRYVMATLVDIHDPGLLVLPTHRTVAHLRDFDPGAFLHRLAKDFAVTACPNLPGLLTVLNQTPHAIGMLLDGKFAILTPRHMPALAPLFANKPPLWDQLDVAILHVAILETMLGIDDQRLRDEANVSYWREPDLAAREVTTGNAQLAFFLRPTPVADVKAVADARSRMPQKSTDFYPKLLSGIVIHEVR